MNFITYPLGALKSIYSKTYSHKQYSAESIYANVNAETLPQEVDLRKLFGEKVPVRNQKEDGACVAFATNTIAQQLEIQDSSRLRENLSPRFTYVNRENQNSEGMYPHDAMRIVSTIGVAREILVPYDKVKTKEEVSPKAYEEASKHKMGQSARVYTIEALKKGIAERNAGAIITFDVYNFSNEFWKKGPNDELKGGHCVAIVGYKDPVEKGGRKKDGYFIIQNSWGTGWGDGGFTKYFYKDFNKQYHDEIYTFVDIKGSEPFESEVPAPSVEVVEPPAPPPVREVKCVIL
jgi:C1A family cysteine protease